MARSRVVILAPHEPWRDPRVHWAATAAAEHHDVLVLGLDELTGKYPADEDAGAYRIVRAAGDRSAQSVIWHAWHGLRLVPFLPGKVLLVVLAAVLFLPVMGLEYLWQLLVQPLRLTRTVRLVAAGVKFGISRLRVALGLSRQRTQGFGSFQRHCTIAGATLASLYVDHVGSSEAVVHCCDLQSLLVGAYLKDRYGCRIVYDSHELWPASLSKHRVLSSWLIRYYEQRLIRHADAVVAVSDPLAEIMNRWYGRSDVAAVPNAELLPAGGVDPTDVQDDPALTAAAEGRVIFLFQGGFATDRGLEELVDAWRGVDSSKAVLALRGVDDVYADSLRRRSADLIASGAIVMLAAVGEDRLVAAARQADVGVIPYRPVNLNHRYCCPNKLSQYMHAGLAILCNDLEHVKAVVGDGDCGLSYDSDDPASLVAAATRLIDDPELLARLRANSLATGRSYHWGAVCGPLLEAYDRLSGRGSD